VTKESVRPLAGASESGTRTAVNLERTATVNEWAGTDRYQIVRRIGEGGMGVVYEAFDRERNQAVAVKSLLYFTPAALYRFKQEFRTLADVHHNNLVRLHELVVTEGDVAFFVMELVGGVDFQAYVRNPLAAPLPVDAQESTTMRLGAGVPPAGNDAPRTSPADFDKLRDALRQLVEGVQALHGAGKLHRDIKPSNILVAPDGRVVILDFGVATELSRVVDTNLSEEREVVGTVRYMSPEQAVADETTAASDWYSVGVMLYEALTGRPPFVGSSFEVLTRKTTGDIVPPADCVDGIPPELDSLCRALLESEPGARPTGPEILRRLGATRSFRPIPSLAPKGDAARATTLVGREDQLRKLRDSFEQVLSGRSVTVRVAGASGMGKSAVAQFFLDGLVETGEAVVLRGRAYERESVPFKAVDSVIDALSRYLVHLEEEKSEVAFPSGIAALARVFPVLRRVPSIGELPPWEATDPQAVRRRAFSALRELLQTLADRQPLVIYIDDAQWGDADSAALLLELVRPPQAPSVLIVMTQRDDDAQASPFLREMRNRWPMGAESVDVSVGALDMAAAQRLALALLEADDATAQKTARAAARESRGNPFLVEELVRSNLSTMARTDGRTLAVLTLDQMVGQRLDRLSGPARRLVELVAVGGRPLPIALIGQAANVGEGVDEAISAARDRRLLRTGLRDGRDIVETAHDRFRETIVAQLSSQTLLEYHGCLADALEASPGTDAEAVAVHLRAAGRNERAAFYSERAAEEAAGKLAFEQAARLFRLTLETGAPSADEARRLRTRLAQVLEWSGRAEEAARVYLEAADGAPALERAELERAASVGLLSSGRIVEGAEVLSRTLMAVGLKAPASTLGSIFWLLVYRVRLAFLSLIGFRFTEREPGAITPEDRVRVDALFAASMGFVLSNVVLGTCMTALSLLTALRLGDRFQVLRSAILEASNHAGLGGTPKKLERSLVALASRLAEQDGSPTARAFLTGNLVASAYLRGEWKKARDLLDESFSTARLHDLRGGWQSSTKVFGCWALNFLGEHRELARRHALLLIEAEELGDMHMSVQLRDGSLAIMWLAADDPEGARRNAEESMALWPKDRYLLQHWHRLYGEGEIELYVGDGAKAYARVDRDTAALKKSFLLNVQHMRVQTMFLRGRCAIASLVAEPALRAERLAEAKGIARRLEKENMPWIAPFAAILNAGVACAAGDRTKAAAELRMAIELAQTASMSGYVTAARHQLGVLIGGEDGQKLVLAAEQAMTAQGIRVPARFASTLVPGQWQTAP
jgi:serine/threonine protein kinase